MILLRFKTLALVSLTALTLAACSGATQSSSTPGWKSYGFDGAGAQ